LIRRHLGTLWVTRLEMLLVAKKEKNMYESSI
jgi:hypothetical protein